jgi:hypothetical protein
MRFKTDENLPVEVTELLRQHRHDAVSVQDQQMAGQADPQVARVCQAEGRALVTLNRALPLIDVEPLDGCIWVVDDHRVRIRGTGPQGTP